MLVEIASRTVVDSASLIIPRNETAIIEVVAANRRLRARIIFERIPTEEIKGQSINVTPVGNEAHITFLGWNNPLGSATTEPFEVAKFGDNQVLYCMVAHHLIGDVDRLDLSFLIGS